MRAQPGADSSSVIFDAIQAAKARGADFVLADTAGRQHSKDNLMNELAKIARVAQKALGRPPDVIRVRRIGADARNRDQLGKLLEPRFGHGGESMPRRERPRAGRTPPRCRGRA